MIDYQANAVVLEQLRQFLTSTSLNDPTLSAKQAQTLTDISKADDYALLGSFVHHLIAHAASDGAEISLLERATDLWQRGLDLFNNLGEIRKNLETAMEKPQDPNSAMVFNKAGMSVQQSARTLSNMQSEIVQLKNDIGKFSHIPPHPRQKDKPIHLWDWSNLAIGRRTDAFVRNITKLGTDTNTRAFAFGVLASYGGNVAGSAYLGRAVGGPRRSHRYRDRLARNAVGSWLGASHLGIGTFKSMSLQLRFGHPAQPSLPPEIQSQLKKALGATFDETHLQPAPDLQIGYQRLIRHLELLDKFTMPSPPDLPSEAWIEKIYGDPNNPPQTLRPQDVGVPGAQDDGTGTAIGPNQPGSQQPGQSDSQHTTGDACKILAGIVTLILVCLAVAFGECVVQWAHKKECTYWDNLKNLSKLGLGAFTENPPQPKDPGMTASGLTAFTTTKQAAQMVDYFYQLHVSVWEALDSAYNYLAIMGLIYPDRLLNQPLFKQFLKLPQPDNNWPHRSESEPEKWYHLYPSTTPENPTIGASPYFQAGLTPEVFAGPDSMSVNIAMPLWKQMALNINDSANLDLDADRDFRDLCWATIGSINKDPVDVEYLKYTEQ